MKIDPAKVQAMLAEMRAHLSPEKFAKVEAGVRGDLRNLDLPGPEGDESRLRLEIMLRMRELDAESLGRFVRDMAATQSRRNAGSTNREE